MRAIGPDILRPIWDVIPVCDNRLSLDLAITRLDPPSYYGKGVVLFDNNGAVILKSIAQQDQVWALLLFWIA